MREGVASDDVIPTFINFDRHPEAPARSAGLEGWPRVRRLWPSFEARPLRGRAPQDDDRESIFVRVGIITSQGNYDLSRHGRACPGLSGLCDHNQKKSSAFNVLSCKFSNTSVSLRSRVITKSLPR